MTLLPTVVHTCAQPACKIASGSGSVGEKAYLSIHDALLKLDWIQVTDCRHPDWPPQIIEAAAIRTSPQRRFIESSDIPSQQTGGAVSPRIEAGSRVELWADSPARILLSGLMLEPGIVGQRVRVRVESLGSTLEGVISGPHAVQIKLQPLRRVR